MSVKVSRILHAGYSIEFKNTHILFDPIFETPFSRNCYAFPSVVFDLPQIRELKIDAVFISHYHDDHCSMDSLKLLDRATPIYIFCIHEDMLEMIRSLGFFKVASLQLGKTVEIGSVQVTPFPALDVDVDSVFHIQAGGLNILNVVDSWFDPDTLSMLKNRGPWDLVLWPFQTMREIEVLSPSRFINQPVEFPHEWLEQIQLLNPKSIVPSSCQFIHEPWSWYNHALFPITYRRFETEINSILPQTQVMRMNPGVSMIMTKYDVHMSSPLPWIKPIGNQNVDYDYRTDLVVPTMAQISVEIAPVNNSERDRVYNYCIDELPQVYSRLYQSEHDYEVGYFSQPRMWRLDLYDHFGQVKSLNYIIKGRQVVRLENNYDTVLFSTAWLTEVPIAKLYAALEQGESLTSMYMRINDTLFEPDCEAQLRDVDVLEDPLVRCLFNGAFGTYQKAQLKRIIENG